MPIRILVFFVVSLIAGQARADDPAQRQIILPPVVISPGVRARIDHLAKGTREAFEAHVVSNIDAVVQSGRSGQQDADEDTANQCLVQAASQQSGHDITSTTEALRLMTVLSQRVHAAEATRGFASEHALYLICMSGSENVLKLITPEGTLEDDPEADEIQAVMHSAQQQARFVGLDLATTKAFSSNASRLGQWPLLMTIGPERVDPFLGVFRPTTRTISIVPGVTSKLGASIILHEAAHHALGTAPDLTDLQTRDRLYRSPVVHILNEAFAYTVEYSAAYALLLNGDRSSRDSVDHVGFDGTPYKSLVVKAAKLFPNLESDLRRDGRLSGEFLARVFEALSQAPVRFDLQRLRPKGDTPPSIDDAIQILPRIYFLGENDRMRITATTDGSAWFIALKQGNADRELIMAASVIQISRRTVRPGASVSKEGNTDGAFEVQWESPRVEVGAATHSLIAVTAIGQKSELKPYVLGHYPSIEVCKQALAEYQPILINLSPLLCVARNQPTDGQIDAAVSVEHPVSHWVITTIYSGTTGMRIRPYEKILFRSLEQCEKQMPVVSENMWSTAACREMRYTFDVEGQLKLAPVSKSAQPRPAE